MDYGTSEDRIRILTPPDRVESSAGDNRMKSSEDEICGYTPRD